MSGDVSYDVGRSRWRQSLAALDRLGVWAALALLIVVASALSPYFFSLNNFLNILNQASVVGVAAVGMTLVMITGGVDLSVGSVSPVALFEGAVGSVDHGWRGRHGSGHRRTRSCRGGQGACGGSSLAIWSTNLCVYSGSKSSGVRLMISSTRR